MLMLMLMLMLMRMMRFAHVAAWLGRCQLWDLPQSAVA